VEGGKRTLVERGLALRYRESAKSETLANSEICRAPPTEEGILRFK
jgi:hypothetical protein